MEGRSLLRGGVLLVVLSVLRIGLDRVGVHEALLPTGDTEVPRLLTESRAARDEEASRSTPLANGETLDPNRSGEEELDRLPGIGPATARAVVAEREARGGFDGPEDLLRVSGIGPATLAKISQYLDFSGGVPLDLRRRTSGGSGTGVGAGGSMGAVLPESTASVSKPLTLVDLNRASLEELQSLPGIGPALARRILENRLREGPFQNPDDLLRVPGIGPAILGKIRALVTPLG
jgi:competence ComEA-like helix-hairpin-helix protein